VFFALIACLKADFLSESLPNASDLDAGSPDSS